MEILLSDIPEEGLHREGTFPASIFDLAEEDAIRPTGPIHYETMIYRFDEAIVFEGSLRAKFQLQCATCLEYVDYEAEFPHWTSDLDLEEGQRSFDLTQLIREDFLLLLPASPQCEELVPGRICPKAALLEEAELEREREETEEKESDAWNALDEWGKPQ